MALSDDEKWILAENLKRQEREDIAKVERGQDASDGDFGSYYALLTGKNSEWVKAHAVSDEGYLSSYAAQLRSLLPDLADKGATILDAGCGPGLLTRALAEGFGARETLGIDISESAVAYGRKTFPRCRFEVVSIDGATDLGRRFDLVHAREFYPFTRTSDPDFHRQYLAALARHVEAGGALVLTLLSSPKSLAANAAALGPDLEKVGMTPFRRTALASSRLASAMPLPAARAATALLARLRGRSPVRFYVSRRAR
ncbi:MAG: methyltransferase domain-containing protein [Elusimicrobia bacterium]|nr:methyltransferase domain-containing protein [Elusimicrobiota bacterium]